MTRMSDKSLLSITEIYIRYQNKLRLSESVQAPGLNLNYYLLVKWNLRALSDTEAAPVEVKIGLIKFTGRPKLHLACYH